MRPTLLALVLLPLLACGGPAHDSTLDRVLERKTLVIGTEPEFRPFEYKNEKGEYLGFDMDMARMLAEDLGVTLEIREMLFDSLIPSLRTGKIDLAISGMTAYPERKKYVSFTDSYFETGLCLLVHVDSGIEKPADADGKGLAVKLGTTGHKEAPKLFPAAKLTVLQAESECVMEVVLGRADAFLYDQLSVLGASKKHPEATRALLEPLTHEPYAMAVRKGDERFLARLNEFLAKIRADGRFDALREKYLRDLPAGSR
jgi:polar amino acid transport system substrate-binding protein